MRGRVPSALGRSIATLPAIQGRIAQVALLAARGVLYDTARAWAEQPERRAALGPRIAAAKYLCTSAAQTATDPALRVALSFGLTRQLPHERLYRDARRPDPPPAGRTGARIDRPGRVGGRVVETPRRAGRGAAARLYLPATNGATWARNTPAT
jgi:hypothetical protein